MKLLSKAKSPSSAHIKLPALPTVALILKEIGIRFVVGMTLLAVFFNGIAGPSFSRHIPHVVELVSDKKVAWPYAQGVVASMENKGSIWYRPILDRPGEPVGLFKMAAAVSSASDPKTPVTVMAGGPVPASFSFFNLGPKSLVNFHLCIIAVTTEEA